MSEFGVICMCRTCQSMYIEVSSWMIRMESTAKHAKDASSVRHRAALFLNGLLYAYKIMHFVKTMMNYHSHMRKPMTKSTLLYLCKFLELLKVCVMGLHHNDMVFFSSQFNLHFIVAHSTLQVILIISYKPTRQILSQ